MADPTTCRKCGGPVDRPYSCTVGNDRWTIAFGSGANQHLGGRVRTEAYAALIVEAVNAYDRLRAVEAAARAVTTFCNCGPDIVQGHEDACIQSEPEMRVLRAALDPAATEPEETPDV